MVARYLRLDLELCRNFQTQLSINIIKRRSLSGHEICPSRPLSLPMSRDSSFSVRGSHQDEHRVHELEGIRQACISWHEVNTTLVFDPSLTATISCITFTEANNVCTASHVFFGVSFPILKGPSNPAACRWSFSNNSSLQASLILLLQPESTSG